MANNLAYIRTSASSLGAGSGTRLATVDGYDPNSHTVKVRYQPDGCMSGWLPVATPWSGNGWGLFCPPSRGDQVVVAFQEERDGGGVVCLRAWSDQDRPLSVPAGEFWLVHAKGACLKLTNDGKLLLSSTSEIDITAPVLNLGSSGESLHQLVTDAFVSVFNSHTHGSSPQPDQQMGAGQLTSTLYAG